MLEVAGHRLHGFHAGAPEAPPLVMVHGLGVSGRYWLPLAERLAAEYAVHVPELPGHGHSSRPARALDVPALADVLEDWLEAAGVPDGAIMVANSMGCQVAAALAVLRPVRTRAMVFIGPTLDPANRSTPRLLARFLGTGFFEKPTLPVRLLVDYARMGVRRYLQEARHMMRDRIERHLPLVSVPTLVLRGAFDLVSPADWAALVAALLPEGRLATVPACGHAVHHAVPDEVALLLRGFLAALPGRPGPR